MLFRDEASIQLATQITNYAPHQSADLIRAYFLLLKHELNLDSVTWMAAYKGKYGSAKSPERKLLSGWLAFDMIRLDTDEKPFNRKTEYVVRAIAQGEPDPLTAACIKAMGKTRTHKMFDCLPGGEQSTHWMREFHASFNVYDRMLGACSISPCCESIILADRNRENVVFSDEDEKKLLYLVQIYKRIHYWIMLERGLTRHDTNPLTPVEKNVLQLLLQGESDKMIARKLEYEYSTTRSYIQSILRKFKVSSKMELVLLWYQDIGTPVPISKLPILLTDYTNYF